jgi:hypothetical protein
LSASRTFLDRGDRGRALEEVDAALAIDPEFVAAHSLRHHILSPPADRLEPRAPGVGPRRSEDSLEPRAPGVGPRRSENVAMTQASSAPQTEDAPPSRPVVSAGGYVKFEERVKRRRVERRLDAARAAIQRQQLSEAAVALDEVMELNPHVPELSALTAALDDLRRSRSSAHRGPWLAAAAIFAVMMLAASWVEDRPALHSRPIIAVSGLAFAPSSSPLLATATMDDEDHIVGTSGRAQVIFVTPNPFTKVTPNAEPAPLITMRSPTAESAAPLNPPPSANTSNAASPTSVENTTSAPKPIVPIADEELPVQRTLLRYRVAYDGLDAHSAQAVWPSVNQAALAHAFDGLESQTLTFENCVVQLRGETATATCRGHMRYVPKIGSREPRTEPRTWNFTLRKTGSDWKIDTARVDR